MSCLSALKWYRASGNIQAEIEEMQEEQRSLSTLETLSVWKLARDDAVRWQVLSVVVINIGMQLSSIDAVSWQGRSPGVASAPCETPSLLLRLQIWFYTNDIFENAGIPRPEIPYTTAGTGIIEIVAALVGVRALAVFLLF